MLRIKWQSSAQDMLTIFEDIHTITRAKMYKMKRKYLRRTLLIEKWL